MICVYYFKLLQLWENLILSQKAETNFLLIVTTLKHERGWYFWQKITYYSYNYSAKKSLKYLIFIYIEIFTSVVMRSWTVAGPIEWK